MQCLGIVISLIFLRLIFLLSANVPAHMSPTRGRPHEIPCSRREHVRVYMSGSGRASSKGYIVRWVEAPSNKLLTTAFEASLESVAVTLQAKRRQQDSRDSYGAPKSQSIRGSTPWSGWKTIYALIVMVRFCMPLRCC